jgi:hypothetical protein
MALMVRAVEAVDFSPDGRGLNGTLVRMWAVHLVLQRDRAWPVRVILYQLVLQAFASRPSGASRGARVDGATLYVLAEPPMERYWHARTTGRRSQSPPARAPIALTHAFPHPRPTLKLVSSASFSLYLSVPVVARALNMPLNTRHPQVILEGVSVPDRGGGTPSLLGPYLADLYLTDSDPTTRSPYSPNPSSPPLPLPSPPPPSSSNHHRHHCRHRPRHLC